MKRDYELMDDSTMDVEDLEVERDVQLAAVDAIRRARRFGTFFVTREDDQLKEIPPDKTMPYEERMLANAAQLDRRIAELRAQEQKFVLNDKPSDTK